MKKVTKETQCGTFNFTYDSEEDYPFKRGIFDALYAEDGWIGSTIDDFANVFGTVPLIKIERGFFDNENSDLAKSLGGKKHLGLVFYCASLSMITNFLKLLNPVIKDDSDMKVVMKAFSDRADELEGSFLIFYEAE